MDLADAVLLDCAAGVVPVHYSSHGFDAPELNKKASSVSHSQRLHMLGQRGLGSHASEPKTLFLKIRRFSKKETEKGVLGLN